MESCAIVNCFSKAGISNSSQQVALTDKDDPLKVLIEELDELQEAHPDAVPENVSAESFSVADDVIVAASAATRNIALLADNCSAHPNISNLSNVKLVFLPPNTTSTLQAMDQGVIRSLKAQYRRQVVLRCITMLDKIQPLPKISILQVMRL